MKKSSVKNLTVGSPMKLILGFLLPLLLRRAEGADLWHSANSAAALWSRHWHRLFIFGICRL